MNADVKHVVNGLGSWLILAIGGVGGGEIIENIFRISDPNYDYSALKSVQFYSAIIWFLVCLFFFVKNYKNIERKRLQEAEDEAWRLNAPMRAEQERIRNLEYQKQEEQKKLAREAQERMDAEKKRLEEERKKAKEYQEELKRIEDIEAAKARGKAKGLAELYKTQIDLLIEYKSRGIEIEKEVYSMREKLLSLEREENNAMIQDLMATLDKL